MIRFIADLHFGHQNILAFDKRPWYNTQEMEDDIVNRWNSVVQSDDTTYILGDFCFGDMGEWARILRRLKGKLVLIRGNHDPEQLSPEVKSCFEKICDYDEIIVDGYRVLLSHYPMLLYKNSHDPMCVMLCGHVHVTHENDFLEKWIKELRDSRVMPFHSYGNIINVGCMMPWMDYTPKTLKEIIEGREAFLNAQDQGLAEGKDLE